MRFIDVKTDFAFNKVFGSKDSKPILMSFLNATLYDGMPRIRDLKIVNPWQTPQIAGMKDTYVDVQAELNDGTTVLVEMQVLNTPGFEKRILYNAARSYSTQLVSGEEYLGLSPVIALTLTDFEMFPEIKEVRSQFRMKEVQGNFEYQKVPAIELVFFDLTKFTKSEDQLTSLVDKWLYFVKNAGKLQMEPERLATVPEIKQALDIADEAKMTLEELEVQHKRRDFIMLQKGWQQKARDDGLAEGIAKGKEEGRVEGKAEIFRAMLAGGMSVVQISELSRLPPYQIEATIAVNRP